MKEKHAIQLFNLKNDPLKMVNLANDTRFQLKLIGKKPGTENSIEIVSG